MRINARRMLQKAGLAESILLVIEDITERLKIEKELKESEQRYKVLSQALEHQVNERTSEIQATNEELEAVVYSMAHDLYSPLRGISGYTGMLNELLEKCQCDAEYKPYTAHIQYITHRMEHMISAVRFLLGIFKANYHKQNINLSDIFTAISKEFMNKDPQHTGEFIIEPNLIDCADNEAVSEVIRSLISNSWKYTTQQPYRIEFGKTYKYGSTIYYIKDNGVGFDNKHAQQIFRPFYKLEGYPTGEQGYGMGLTIAHAIIRKHLGDIWAEGDEGKGATFYFTLAGSETCIEAPRKAA